MAHKPLFDLDADGRWRLAFDRQQWVVQRRVGKPRSGRSGSAAVRDTGWKGISFVGSEKRILRRVLLEAGVVLAPEAQARLNALPELFLDFIAAPQRFAARLEAKAA